MEASPLRKKTTKKNKNETPKYQNKTKQRVEKKRNGFGTTGGFLLLLLLLLFLLLLLMLLLLFDSYWFYWILSRFRFSFLIGVVLLHFETGPISFPSLLPSTSLFLSFSLFSYPLFSHSLILSFSLSLSVHLDRLSRFRSSAARGESKWRTNETIPSIRYRHRTKKNRKKISEMTRKKEIERRIQRRSIVKRNRRKPTPKKICSIRTKKKETFQKGREQFH